MHDHRPPIVMRTVRNIGVPLARPNPLVVIWRWRYELAVLAGVPGGAVLMLHLCGATWTLVWVNVLTALVAGWPAARRRLTARAWCVITAHRVRTGCAQAWIHSRHGKIPIILATSPMPFGERVHLWCRAGTSPADLASARDLLRTACWAQDIHIHPNAQYTHLVTLDVIRRDPEMMAISP